MPAAHSMMLQLSDNIMDNQCAAIWARPLGFLPNPETSIEPTWPVKAIDVAVAFSVPAGDEDEFECLWPRAAPAPEPEPVEAGAAAPSKRPAKKAAGAGPPKKKRKKKEKKEEKEEEKEKKKRGKKSKPVAAPLDDEDKENRPPGF
ncbi:hypothetical protein ACET3X_006481 [Alternaria dauci]|uniref:Uncharacterized protein n=1 Tax=Alternaria dauci TaxID=48095 RepID=A0ABR3UE73_9PLEO